MVIYIAQLLTDSETQLSMGVATKDSVFTAKLSLKFEMSQTPHDCLDVECEPHGCLRANHSLHADCTDPVGSC